MKTKEIEKHLDDIQKLCNYKDEYIALLESRLVSAHDELSCWKEIYSSAVSGWKKKYIKNKWGESFHYAVYLTDLSFYTPGRVKETLRAEDKSNLTSLLPTIDGNKSVRQNKAEILKEASTL